MKIKCNKMRKRGNPYEIWKLPDGSWRWEVLKKWQADDDKEYARWFVDVYNDIVPNGEMGDEYVSNIKKYAKLVKTDYDPE